MEKIHFVGIGGVGTGTLAVALSRAGYSVSGSDGALYEPMKGVLEAAQIRLVQGYHAETARASDADTVLIGNVIRRDNPEAGEWIRKGTPYVSFPEAVRRYVIGAKRSVVCAGTHGKTTTTAWTAFLFQQLGLDPSYLIGGVPVDLEQGCRIASGDCFIGEGDEYDSAFFDKGPKFLHYNPHCLILANIEFDHADIYRDLAHVQSAFDKAVALLPGTGLCVVRHEDAVAQAVASAAACPVQTFGLAEGAHWRVSGIRHEPEGVLFTLDRAGKNMGEFRTRLFGEHNVLNLVSGLAAAVHFGAKLDDIRSAMPLFRGVRRRQQILATEPITLVDDFAHHPTEVAATLSAVRQRFRTGTLWAFFEPRSATARRGSHQDLYPGAFSCADRVFVAEAQRVQDLPEGQRFSGGSLVQSLAKAGKQAQCLEVDAMVEAFAAAYRPGDTAVVMSNGEFGKIQQKILQALK